MRTLTAALTAAQKLPTRTPVITLQAHNKLCGVERLSFTRLYTGAEADAYHGATISGDGSLIRAQLSGGTVWYQRVASPGPSSTYSTWTNSGLAAANPIAVTAVGAEVSIFYIVATVGSESIRRLKSTNNGASFTDELVIALGIAVGTGAGLAAAYSPNGNVVAFYITGGNITVRWTRQTGGGAWSAIASASLAGGWSVVKEITTVGQPDNNLWPIAAAVLKASGDKLIVLSQYNWSTNAFATALEVAGAPSAATYDYCRPFLGADTQVRLTFTEKFTGTTAYERVFHTWQVPGAAWTDNLSAEPEPFDHTCNCGLAPAIATSYVWLCKPGGVWRATRTVTAVDLSASVLRLKASEDPSGGDLVAELRNDDARYASPGTGALAALHVGSEIRLAIGYKTTTGSETSWANYYHVSALTHVSQGGKATLVITAHAPRRRLSEWTARHAYRWNAVGFTSADVIKMLQVVFARAGIYLSPLSFSTIADTFQPDFTIYPGQTGTGVVVRLLKLVPDVIRSDLEKCELLNPLQGFADYVYGTDHAILEGEYATLGAPVTRVRAEGRSGATPIVGDSFDWPGIVNVADRLAYIFDTTITSAAQATERGTAYLRDAAIAGSSGEIVVPTNAGQELYDVVTITDARAGLVAVYRRVLGLKLLYDPRKGVYTHTLALGAV